jgi:hypothetical protein
MLVSVSTYLEEKVCGKLKFEAILGKFIFVCGSSLTKQNGVWLFGKFKKKFKKKKLKPTYPT